MEANPSPSEALKLAVSKAGGQAATARICGVSQPAVWKWLRLRKSAPAHLVLKLETATGVSRHALRPDIYPLPLPLRPDPDPNQAGFEFLSAGAARVACDRNLELQRKDIL